MTLAGRRPAPLDASGISAQWYDQDGIARLVATYNRRARDCRYMKAHLAFMEQIECVLPARDAVFFQIWRDWRETLVSDFHFQQNLHGRRFADFDSYYWKTGRTMLLRSRIQYLNWRALDDPRIVHASYEGLATDFDRVAPAMLAPLKLGPIDLTELQRRTSVAKMRKRLAKKNKEIFVRAASIDSHKDYPIGTAVQADIDQILAEPDVSALVGAYDKATRLRSLAMGREYARRDPRRRLRLAFEHAGMLPAWRRAMLRLRQVRPFG